MTEEQVTKSILKWLIDREWEIVCFDFPQSGTGRLLHPDNAAEKNKDSINPDIVAVKNGVCLFFENKNRYDYSDYIKQYELITENKYTGAISDLLNDYHVDNIYYGIGLPSVKLQGAARDNQELVDFIIGVDEDRSSHFLFNKFHIAI